MMIGKIVVVGSVAAAGYVMSDGVVAAQSLSRAKAKAIVVIGARAMIEEAAVPRRRMTLLYLSLIFH